MQDITKLTDLFVLSASILIPNKVMKKLLVVNAVIDDGNQVK